MTIAGCTTDDPPPEAAGSPTARLGTATVRLDPGRRLLIAGDERIPVGIGPTDVASDGRTLAYVTDKVGNAVLVVRLRPRFEITRRVHVPGGPYAVTVDRERQRMLVRTAGGTVTLTAGERPRRVGP
jgi:hypothetical protein